MSASVKTRVVRKRQFSPLRPPPSSPKPEFVTEARSSHHSGKEEKSFHSRWRWEEGEGEKNFHLDQRSGEEEDDGASLGVSHTLLTARGKKTDLEKKYARSLTQNLCLTCIFIFKKCTGN